MIPEQAIVEWRREAPWSANALVEQDLVISRALVEMYSFPEIAERLAFRGGTALYKRSLYVPATRRWSPPQQEPRPCRRLSEPRQLRAREGINSTHSAK